MNNGDKTLLRRLLKSLVFLWFIVGLFSEANVYGQTKTIAGRVIDEIGEPLLGVNVSVKCT